MAILVIVPIILFIAFVSVLAAVITHIFSVNMVAGKEYNAEECIALSLVFGVVITVVIILYLFA